MSFYYSGDLKQWVHASDFGPAGARERELAIRSALGASGHRLIQQLLSESVVLGITSGAVGLASALASLHVFMRLLPADTPRIQDVSLHAGDVLFTLGASVLAGLLFGLIPSIKMSSINLLTPQDSSGATHAAVINERMAQRLWPNQNPIGKHILDVNDAPAPAVWDAAKASIIVGVVRNAREDSLEGGFNDEVYLPMTPTREQPVMYVLLHTRSTPADTAAELRSAIAGIDSQVPITRVRTLGYVVANSVAAPRALAILLLGFGALAVLIGTVGVYSLIAYIVSWRTREIGLRLALGAQRWQIVLAVIRQSLLLAGGGCVAGFIGAIGLSRLLHSFLFEVSPLDPITYCAVPLLMLVIALIAAWIPARRAAAVDPMQALRAD